MPADFERLSLPLLLLGLAGCASTAASPRDNEAFGGEPAVPATAPAPSPDPLPSSAPPWKEPSTLLEPVAPAPPPADEPHGRGHDKWEFVLFGTGASDQDVSNGSAAISGSLGYMLGDHFLANLRQDYFFNDGPGTGSSDHASTRLALDFLIGEGDFVPFIGANVGYVYGDFVKDTWEAAPEAGFKLFLRDHVFLQLMAEYQFFFDTTDEADEAFNDGSLVYSLGLGMTF